MSSIYRSRIPIVDEDNPIAYGRDDVRGLPIMHDDMVQVMEYMGSQIQWTGYMTHKDYVDIPQPQRCPPILQPDPVPVPNIRILNRPNAPPIPLNLTASDITSTSVLLTWTPVEVATSYNIGWEGPNHVFQQLSGITDIPYELTSLAPNTYYLISVASYYPDTTSAYSLPIGITTLPAGAIMDQNPYLIYTQSADLPNAQNLGLLPPGILKITVAGNPEIAEVSIAEPGVDYLLPTGVATLAGANAFTGTNTYNTNLPTSTLTPTAANQLITKAYGDTAYGIKSAANTWSNQNTFNTNPLFPSGAVLNYVATCTNATTGAWSWQVATTGPAPATATTTTTNATPANLITISPTVGTGGTIWGTYFATDGANANNTIGGEFACSYINLGGSVTIIGSPWFVQNVTATPAVSVTFVGVGATISFQVTGPAGATVVWNATYFLRV